MDALVTTIRKDLSAYRIYSLLDKSAAFVVINHYNGRLLSQLHCTATRINGDLCCKGT